MVSLRLFDGSSRSSVSLRHLRCRSLGTSDDDPPGLQLPSGASCLPGPPRSPRGALSVSSLGVRPASASRDADRLPAPPSTTRRDLTISASPPLQRGGRVCPLRGLVSSVSRRSLASRPGGCLLQVPFRPCGFSPLRRVPPHTGCERCRPLPTLGFARVSSRWSVRSLDPPPALPAA